MLKFTYVGLDSLSRPTYKDQHGSVWKDTSLGEGDPDICKSSNNEIEGEPDYEVKEPYEFETQYKVSDRSFDYMMLSRLESDCDYYLGFGCRSQGRTTGENGAGTIAEMKKIWNSLPEQGKPVWLTMEDILEYEEEMQNPSGKYDDKYSWGEYRRAKKEARKNAQK